MFKRILKPPGPSHTDSSDEEKPEVNRDIFEKLNESKRRTPSPLDWLKTITLNLDKQQHLWKLFIDFCKQPIEGWRGFEEREPGYLAGMKKAFLHMLATYEEDLSVDLVKAFHRHATQKVDMGLEDHLCGKFRDHNVYFGLGETNQSEQGMLSVLHYIRGGKAISQDIALVRLRAGNGVLDEQAHFNPNYEDDEEEYQYSVDLSIHEVINQHTIDYVLKTFKEYLQRRYADRLDIDNDNLVMEQFAKYIHRYYKDLSIQSCQTMYWVYNEESEEPEIAELVVPMPKEKISDYLTEKMQCILDEYHTALIQLASSDTADKIDKCLTIIVKCCQQLEWLHPFADGNCRTFGMILLNRLLIENNFYPCIMDDPNQLDCFSINELVEAIKQGMRNFATIYSTPVRDLKTPSPSHQAEVTAQGVDNFQKEAMQQRRLENQQKRSQSRPNLFSQRCDISAVICTSMDIEKNFLLSTNSM